MAQIIRLCCYYKEGLPWHILSDVEDINNVLNQVVFYHVRTLNSIRKFHHKDSSMNELEKKYVVCIKLSKGIMKIFDEKVRYLLNTLQFWLKRYTRWYNKEKRLS